MSLRPFVTLCVIGLLVAVAIGWSSSSRAQWQKITGFSIGPPSDLKWAGAIVFKHGEIWAGLKDLYVSKDTGRSWTQIFYPEDGTPIVDIDVFDSDNIVVAAQDDISVSTDGGHNWRIGHTYEDFLSATYVGSKENLVMTENPTQSGGGLWYSTNGGSFWNFSLEPGKWPAKVVYRPERGDVIAVDGTYGIDGAHVYVSTDSGLTWKMRSGVLDYDYYGIAYGGCKSSHIYVAVNNAKDASDEQRSFIAVSTDDGESFTSTASQSPPFLCGSICVGDDAIFCQTVDEGIVRSTDGGATWKSIGGPSCITSYYTRVLAAISGNILIAADASGNLFMTRNSGGDPIPASFPETETPLVLNTAIETVYQGRCGVVDTAFTFGINLCDTGSVQLTSVTLSGSHNFLMRDAGALPRTIAAWDSITISYLNKSSTIDTAYLDLKYSILGATHDTALLLIGIGTTAILQMPYRSLGVGSGYCGPVAIDFPFGSAPCDSGQIMLLAVKLSSSTDFQLTNAGTLPRTVGKNDSIGVLYLNRSAIPDTAYLTLSYVALGNSHDTTLMITGEGAAGMNLVSIPKDTIIRAIVDSGITLPVTVLLSDSAFTTTLNPQSLSYALTFDTSFLTYTNMSSLNVTPRPGWNVSSAQLRGNVLTVNLSNIFQDTLKGSCFLGTVTLLPKRATLSPTSVSLSGFSIKPVDLGDVSFCLVPEQTLIAVVATESAAVEAYVPETQFEFYPDPVQSKKSFHVVLPYISDGVVRISIYDVMGIERYNSEFRKESTTNQTVNISGQSLPTGTYYLRVQQREVIQTRKIQILN
jgi:hypothetical protein